MKKRIAVITTDELLFQKIYLYTRDDFTAERVLPTEAKNGRLAGYEVCILDVDSCPAIDDASCRIITLGRCGADIPRPFDRLMLNKISEQLSGGAMLHVRDGRAYFKNEEIRLTEMELLLLERLIRAGGDYVGREEILHDVWGDGASDGILNVYIHYLREKLEWRGEKIILSSRKHGYKIDEKYLAKNRLQ